MAKSKEHCKPKVPVETATQEPYKEKESVHTEKPKVRCKPKEHKETEKPKDPCDFLTQNKCYENVKPKDPCEFLKQKKYHENEKPKDPCDFSDRRTFQNRDPYLDEQDDEEWKECACRTDLYFIGKAWIDILKCGLLGVPSVMPVVEAEDSERSHERSSEKSKQEKKRIIPKPPKMGYQDLPIYTSPHYEYKACKDEDKWCPEAKVKLGQQYLLPIVKSYRKWASQNWTDFKDELNSMKKEAKGNYDERKNNFLKYVRDPNHIVLRSVIVALGGSTGYCISSGKLLSRRILYTGVGLLAAGALCFPQETDYAVRSIGYSTGKIVLAMYNKFTGSNVVWREKLPCTADIPPLIPALSSNQCPGNERVRNKIKDEYEFYNRVKRHILRVNQGRESDAED